MIMNPDDIPFAIVCADPVLLIIKLGMGFDLKNYYLLIIK